MFYLCKRMTYYKMWMQFEKIVTQLNSKLKNGTLAVREIRSKILLVCLLSIGFLQMLFYCS